MSNEELDELLVTLTKHGVKHAAFDKGQPYSLEFHPPAPATVPAPPSEDDETQRTDTELAALALAGRRRAPQQNEGG